MSTDRAGAGRERFCEQCDVSLDLHPDDSDWACEVAERKASAIEEFFGRMATGAIQ